MPHLVSIYAEWVKIDDDLPLTGGFRAVFPNQIVGYGEDWLVIGNSAFQKPRADKEMLTRFIVEWGHQGVQVTLHIVESTHVWCHSRAVFAVGEPEQHGAGVSRGQIVAKLANCSNRCKPVEGAGKPKFLAGDDDRTRIPVVNAWTKVGDEWASAGAGRTNDASSYDNGREPAR